MAITSYDAYLRRLESIYYLHGYSVSDTILRDFIVRERLDVNFKITIQDLRKDLTAIHNKTSTRTPSPSPSRTVQKPVTNPVSPASQAVIKTYPEYMAALEKLYINKGKVILTDTEIQNFISINKIDTAFGITRADVKKDLQIIDRKWHPQVSYVTRKDLQDIEKKSNAAKPSPITSLENYEQELTTFIAQNGDKSFLDLYIQKFISAHGMDTRNPNLMSDIRMDLAFAQSKLPLTSATAKGFRKQAAKPIVSAQPTTDNKFKSDVASIILKHKDAFSKSPSIKGLLWDYFPDKKRETNVLMILVSYGMLDDMRLEKTLGSVFITKYVTRIVNEYGIDKNFAMEMALVWCHGYGEGLLGKKLIL